MALTPPGPQVLTQPRGPALLSHEGTWLPSHICRGPGGLSQTGVLGSHGPVWWHCLYHATRQAWQKLFTREMQSQEESRSVSANVSPGGPLEMLRATEQDGSKGQPHPDPVSRAEPAMSHPVCHLRVHSTHTHYPMVRTLWGCTPQDTKSTSVNSRRLRKLTVTGNRKFRCTLIALHLTYHPSKSGLP